MLYNHEVVNFPRLSVRGDNHNANFGSAAAQPTIFVRIS